MIRILNKNQNFISTSIRIYNNRNIIFRPYSNTLISFLSSNKENELKFTSSIEIPNNFNTPLPLVPIPIEGAKITILKTENDQTKEYQLNNTSDSIKEVDSTKSTSSLFFDEENLSIRQRLKHINPDKNLLHFLDHHKLGYIPHRRERVLVAKRLGSEERLGFKRVLEDKLFPFHKPGKYIKSMKYFQYNDLRIFGAPPQVALIGRSNSGKSTLLNTLLNFDGSYVQKAKMSDKPGETKEISLYSINKFHVPIVLPYHSDYKEEEENLKNEKSKKEKTLTNIDDEKEKSLDDEFEKFNGEYLKNLTKNKLLNTEISKVVVDSVQSLNREKTLNLYTSSMILVDLPGYGFAYLNEQERERIHELNLNYLLLSQKLHGKPLKKALLLLDARHGLKKSDVDFLKELEERYQDLLEVQERKLHNLEINLMNKELKDPSLLDFSNDALLAPIPPHLANSKESLIKGKYKNLTEKFLLNINQYRKKNKDLKISDGNLMNLSNEILLKDYTEKHCLLPNELSWKLQIVFTKADLVERQELSKRILLLQEDLKKKINLKFFKLDSIIILSGLKNQGVIELKKELKKLVDNDEDYNKKLKKLYINLRKCERFQYYKKQKKLLKRELKNLNALKNSNSKKINSKKLTNFLKKREQEKMKSESDLEIEKSIEIVDNIGNVYSFLPSSEWHRVENNAPKPKRVKDRHRNRVALERKEGDEDEERFDEETINSKKKNNEKKKLPNNDNDEEDFLKKSVISNYYEYDDDEDEFELDDYTKYSHDDDDEEEN